MKKKWYQKIEPNNLSAGSLEQGPHNNAHGWTAARDPIFFAHHSNVPGGYRRDFTDDDDWLESSFLFYDGNKNLVRVKVVKDCLDSRKLGYDYEYVDTQWLRTRTIPKYPVSLPLPVPLPQPLPFHSTYNCVERGRKGEGVSDGS